MTDERLAVLRERARVWRSRPIGPGNGHLASAAADALPEALDEIERLRRQNDLLWQELTLKRPIAERAIRMYRDGTLGNEGAVFGLEAECREYELQIGVGDDPHVAR